MFGRKTPAGDDPAGTGPSWSQRLGLSGKLLALTACAIMMAEVIFYVPSVASYRLTWLNDRLAAAKTAALVFRAAPEEMVPDWLQERILDSIGARMLAMRVEQKRRVLASMEIKQQIRQDVDMRDTSMLRSILGAFDTLLFCKDRDIMRVVGPAPMGGEFVEIVINEGPLRDAMWRYSRNILVISLIISTIAAALLYFALHYMFVRPMHRITGNMIAFRADPENPARVIAVSGRPDEIGIAERELAVMEKEFAQTLQQKSRLAALGLAVSKINHDLRNLLASACRSTTTSTRPGSAGAPPTGRRGCGSWPTPTDSTGTAARSSSRRWTMRSTASKPPSGAASTRVTRTTTRWCSGPEASRSTTAAAAGGPTTSIGSPPPSSDTASLGPERPVLRLWAGPGSPGPRHTLAPS